MPDVGRGLTGLHALKKHGRVDQAERVNHDFTLHGLDGVDDDGNGADVQSLERLRGLLVLGPDPRNGGRQQYLLCVDVDT